jgi:hypothetical protein
VSDARRFYAALALLLVLLFAATKPTLIGDVDEYALTTIAIADHGSADIRLADVAHARTLLPPSYDPLWDLIGHGIADGRAVPKPGFVRDNAGQVRALHFFAYPALAAPSLKLFEAVGVPPSKCFQAVNLALVFVLGAALLRLFGDARRALAGVAAFLLCGGFLYASWSSPEAMSAAALLAALAFACTGAPLAAGLLAGLAAMHNPPIGLFCVFAPLLQRATGMPWREALAPRNLSRLGLAGVLAALPIAWSMYTFGEPSVIAKHAASPELASLMRLQSLFFDLSQGMLIGVPALMAAVAFWCARRAPVPALLAVAFAVAMAAPALVTQNWNSAAAGMMRYAFWCAMPLLFVFLWELRAMVRLPVLGLAALVLVQAGALHLGRRYGNLDFNPVARAVLLHAPAWYDPEPEIFYERVAHVESYPNLATVAVYRGKDGAVRKTLLHSSNPAAAAAICGTGSKPGPENEVTQAGRGWIYLNGPVKCVAA